MTFFYIPQLIVSWWHHRSRSTLAQVMTCCLTASSHYLNQCSFLISEILRHSHESNITARATANILYSEFENHIFEITPTSPRGQYVTLIFIFLTIQPRSCHAVLHTCVKPITIINTYHSASITAWYHLWGSVFMKSLFCNGVNFKYIYLNEDILFIRAPNKPQRSYWLYKKH